MTVPQLALAQGLSEPGVVVELYTSQGCASCPPADALMEQLVQQPGVIALSLHVDYWDYIGWQDTFGNARFTARQKAYAHAAGEKMIYTPQIIVAGGERLVGNEGEAVAVAVQRGAGRPSDVALMLSRDGDMVTINAQSPTPLPAPVRVQLVRYLPQQTVEIAGGENAGQIVTYSNIVTDWQIVGEWSGQEPLALTVPAGGTQPVVVILQNEGPSDIVAAARLR
ncbi:DUF1223 domain-containing protein [Paracoccaceae bacterium]